MKKFDYGKAEADLYDSGYHKSEKGINDFMRENGLNPDKYYKDDNPKSSGSSSSGGNDSSGCFLTSACVKAKGLADDCKELEILRNFRDNYMSTLPDGKAEIRRYYEIAPIIVDNINRQSDSWSIWEHVYNGLIIPAVDLIKAGNNEQAYLHYKDFTLSLETKYIGR